MSYPFAVFLEYWSETSKVPDAVTKALLDAERALLFTLISPLLVFFSSSYIVSGLRGMPKWEVAVEDTIIYHHRLLATWTNILDQTKDSVHWHTSM